MMDAYREHTEPLPRLVCVIGHAITIAWGMTGLFCLLIPAGALMQ